MTKAQSRTLAGRIVRRALLPALLAGAVAAAPAMAQDAAARDVDARIARVAPRVVAWRRDIHQHPELGNHETRTAALVEAHLRALGYDVRTGVAGTGVIGVLKGARAGGTVALRADMDALPIREATGLPFASTVTTDVDGKAVPVMHACGHDAHVAMLMGAAEVLAGLKHRIAGTVMLVFQPAEEGVAGEVAGAARMVREGAFAAIRPDAFFALHVEPGRVGDIDVRAGPFLSSASSIRIDLAGRQTHAGRPWEGTDLVNLGADIVKMLATVAARRFDVFEFPNVVSIGSLQIGTRSNILPGAGVLEGTIRTFDPARRDAIKALVRSNVDLLAQGYGGTARVTFQDTAEATRNDPALVETILPALRAAAGRGTVHTDALLRGAAEDFSAFESVAPGVYYILGSTPDFTTKAAAPTNHSDRFDIDEAVLPIGVKAHVLTALRFLDTKAR